MNSKSIPEIQPKNFPTEWRVRLNELSLQPLWESEHTLKEDTSAPDDGNLWAWRDMRAMMAMAGEVSSPKVVERRVIEMLDPRKHFPKGEATVGTINACMQLLNPGESARPHRHSIAAIRFVLESTGGGKTIVDGKSICMEEGDLILTPGWCWHEHVHEGVDPLIWLDVLDLSLHKFFGTDAFEFGPIRNQSAQLPDDSFRSANIVPISGPWPRNYSPVFYYPWTDAAAALEATPVASDGTRAARYINPLTGGAALPFLDMTLLGVGAGRSHCVERTTTDMVLCPMKGVGKVKVNRTVRQWQQKDIISVPKGAALELAVAGEDSGTFFVVTNAPVLERLGLI